MVRGRRGRVRVALVHAPPDRGASAAADRGCGRARCRLEPAQAVEVSGEVAAHPAERQLGTGGVGCGKVEAATEERATGVHMRQDRSDANVNADPGSRFVTTE